MASGPQQHCQPQFHYKQAPELPTPSHSLDDFVPKSSYFLPNLVQSVQTTYTDSAPILRPLLAPSAEPNSYIHAANSCPPTQSPVSINKLVPPNNTHHYYPPAAAGVLSNQTISYQQEFNSAPYKTRIDALIDLLEDELVETDRRPKQIIPSSAPILASQPLTSNEKIRDSVSATGGKSEAEETSPPSRSGSDTSIVANAGGGAIARRFACDFAECGKAFPTAAGLRSHFLTHTGERPFQCAICEKSYTTNNRLKIHVRSHTNERPYACDFPGCDYRTKQKCSLTPHKVKHLSTREKEVALLVQKRTLQCDICGRMYKTADSLDQHTWKEHKKGAASGV